MATWTTKKLGEIATEKRIAYMPFSSEHLPYLGLEHIEQQSLRLSGIGDSAEAGSQKKRFQNGEILYGSLRPYFRKVYRPKFEGVCSTDITVLSAKDGNLNEYLFYLIADADFIERASNSSNGTKMPRAGWNIVKDFEFKIPNFATQSCIAGILSTYDDLIENNEKRIKALEEMAQLLYTEWFIKFKFPGHEKVKMVDSGTEYGLIPEKWEILRLDQIAGINTETFKKTDDSEVINYIDIASVSTGKIDVIQSMPFSEAPSRARRLIRHGDILWSTVRPNRKSYSLVINPVHNLVASTGFAVIRSIEIPYTYLYHSLTTDDFVGYLVNHVQGAAYPAVKGEDFEKAMILLPTPVLLDKFHNLTLGLYNEKETLRRKNIHLQEMRDLLIPQLVTGKRILK